MINEEYVRKLFILLKPINDKYNGKPFPRSIFILFNKYKIKVERTWRTQPSEYHILDKNFKPINGPYMAWETDSYIIIGYTFNPTKPIHGKYLFYHIPKSFADQCLMLNHLPF